MKRAKKKIVLYSYLSLGDIVVFSAAIRDFIAVYGWKYSVAVDTPFPDVFAYNEDVNCFSFFKDGDTYVDDDGEEIESYRIDYPLIQESNQRPYHFIHGYRKHLSGIFGHVPQGEFRGDIRLSDEEASGKDILDRYGIDANFWIINAGGKYDFSVKWWHPERYREVVKRFSDRIQFVQVGRSSDFHQEIPEAISLIDQTSPRDLINLTYHADGIVCGVTAMMHLAAAVPRKSGHPEIRPCVVIAGAREAAHWEQYPGHRFLENCGALPCSPAGGGCWRSRCQEVGDGDDKDDPENLCRLPVLSESGVKIPKCMDMITVDDVERAILSYYDGGVLAFDGNHPEPIHST